MKEMTKLKFVAQQFKGTKNKMYERYVITRIWHRLNDLEIKPITQQYIKRGKNGSYALADLYFPQLKLVVEVDEGHHKHQVAKDKIREKDISLVTKNQIKRVNVTKSIEGVHQKIEEIIKEIKSQKNKKKENRNFTKWNPEKENSPNYWIRKKRIKVDDNVGFTTMWRCYNLFGYSYNKKNYSQKPNMDHCYDDNTNIWCPKLYENDEWDNSISGDEKTITEKPKNKSKKETKKEIDDRIKKYTYRIVFARVKDSFNNVMYKFKGKYELNPEKSNYEDGVYYERVSKKVKVYEPKE